MEEAEKAEKTEKIEEAEKTEKAEEIQKMQKKVEKTRKTIEMEDTMVKSNLRLPIAFSSLFFFLARVSRAFAFFICLVFLFQAIFFSSVCFFYFFRRSVLSDIRLVWRSG